MVSAAAGNQRSAVGRPAACTGAFAVAALNRQGFKSFYSNYGPQVALATVGGDENRGATGDALLADAGIVSTSNDGIAAQGNCAYASGSGTSFAAPAAAGVASLMLALNPDTGGSPDPTPSTGGGGGGAMPPLWLAGLLLAVGLAARTARDE